MLTRVLDRGLLVAEAMLPFSRWKGRRAVRQSAVGQSAVGDKFEREVHSKAEGSECTL